MLDTLKRKLSDNRYVILILAIGIIGFGSLGIVSHQLQQNAKVERLKLIKSLNGEGEGLQPPNKDGSQLSAVACVQNRGLDPHKKSILKARNIVIKHVESTMHKVVSSFKDVTGKEKSIKKICTKSTAIELQNMPPK